MVGHLAIIFFAKKYLAKGCKSNILYLNDPKNKIRIIILQE